MACLIVNAVPEAGSLTLPAASVALTTGVQSPGDNLTCALHLPSAPTTAGVEPVTPAKETATVDPASAVPLKNGDWFAVMPSVSETPSSLVLSSLAVIWLANGAFVSIVNVAAALDEAVLPARSVIETVACGVPSASTVPAGKATCHLPAASTGVSTLTAAAPLASSIESFELGSAVPASTGLVTLVRPSVELRPESLSLSPTDPEAMPIVGAVTLESKVNV